MFSLIAEKILVIIRVGFVGAALIVILSHNTKVVL